MPHARPDHFPFSAVVGSDDMALALVLTTISPAVGGVLVRGEKGTAKSTMVRALASVLPPIDVYAGDRFSIDPRSPEPTTPDGPIPADAAVEARPVRLVELPVGATEDRVLGSLHLEKALSAGVAEYEPGLLARAHRGILYVDEVNLLHDHLVDLLLDAAAMGRSTVERDGVSVEHPARFVLVGTMNPEEGELRPQLLDRFGLTVEVAAPRDPELRVEVVRRRIAFENDPAGFAASYAGAESELTERILAAQELVEQVVLGDAALLKIAEICAAFDVDGMRADIVTARTAVAHAAWHGRTSVGRDDIRVAARLALPHRRRRNPFDAPGIDEDLLDALLGEDDLPPEPDGPGPDDAPESPDQPDENASSTDSAEGTDPANASDHGAPDSGAQDGGPDRGDQASGTTDEPDDPVAGAGAHPDAPGEVVRADQPYRPRLFTVSGTGSGEAGRRSRAITESGRRIGARSPLAGQGGSIHLIETIRAAAPHQALRGRSAGPLAFRGTDLRVATKEGHESNLILFCVDASGSMAARKRMEQVKTAILSLLLDAYQRRDKVGLVTFRGDSADLALPPTGSVEIAAARLDDLPAGGRTPLAEGLLTASEALRLERIRDPRRRPLLVVVTDGRATYGPDAVARSRQVAAHLAAQGTAALVIDCETGRFRMGLARNLADELRAEYVALGDVSASALTGAVHGSLGRGPEGTGRRTEGAA
ncbi:magnesium chelatase subunit D family protein [Nocardioides sp. AE5]|uniref:magnesium chelatase subunit D family protein n=1 Tax=Nocardioides sp. AE5 TaxID=2962573 RepID=UPI0028818B87|nr:magnesium chelatase subunit D family protein [Nocardioides sp. AE5]MDT0202199.1 magnesium chelatase subunit D family protein [Nocardioides sp. AE5]